MARVWIEDRETHADYQEAIVKWKAAKKAGSKRQPPGRWRVRWYGPDGKGKAKTFGKLPQAEAEVTAITTRLDKGSYRDPALGKALFSVVAEEWFATKRSKARTTLRDYRELLDSYVLPKWSGWQVSAVQWAEVSAWIAELCDQPGLSGRKLGAARVIKTYRVFAMVMKHAVKSGRIAVNPATDHELPAVDDDDDHVYLTHEQLERLADAADDYRTLILVLGYCGIRWGEASAVKVGRINAATRRLRIVQAYSDVKGVLALGPVKNHEKRSVPLPRSFAEELSAAAAGLKAADLLFTAPGGGPLRYSNFRGRVFDKAVKAAGLGGLGITPHKLRHTAASLAIAAGADVKVIQLMLGHKDAAMTLNIYGHLWPDRLDEVADALDAKRERLLLRTRLVTAMRAVVERGAPTAIPTPRTPQTALVA
ncbi:tyrosine-type recombinase/integrase [Yinghuangia seranimata]|uniref:tyrosine-type recombinase/integrase n=1 Tax=Yinghuangia seranimata TaxID=408067 RepID=UPI00248D01DD|nr:tyrosine-type recombinase/integrase [Yinghuangia seranimata]MDI2127941.1 tyrosine-type recombinase/integrase [Yinghuangia seranimata]